MGEKGSRGDAGKCELVRVVKIRYDYELSGTMALPSQQAALVAHTSRNVGRPVDPAAVARHGVGGMIVTHDI